MSTKQIIVSCLICVFAALLHAMPVRAQTSLVTENIALGGGGTAYLTGFESLFVNPANLYIQEKNYRFQLSFLQGGYYFDTLLPESNNPERFNRFRNNIGYYGVSSTRTAISQADKESILNASFPANRLRGEFSTQSDFYWFGVKWVRPNRSLGLSLRTRTASRYEMGRGIFSTNPVDIDGLSIIDQSLNHRYQVLHELSFGVAESFEFLNGLFPNLSEFIVGIAPKIVIPGAFIDASFINQYQLNPDNGQWFHSRSYSQQTAGVVSERAGIYTGNTPAINPPTNFAFRDLLNPGGFGLGLDAGITYIITFGDDFSVLRQQNIPTEQSLRLSLSVTDLGLILYNNSPVSVESETLQTSSAPAPSTVNFLYEGIPNEHYSFLSLIDGFQDLRPTFSHDEENFETLLPLSIHAGALFQFRRIKLTGDLSYSVVRNAFNPSGLTSYLGIELRPLQFLPVRAGTRFAPHLQGFYSVGTGIETRYFDLNASVLLRTSNGTPSSEILGASVIGLKLYL